MITPVRRPEYRRPLSPITRKPIRVKTFMPKRISLVSTGISSSAGSDPEGVDACHPAPLPLEPRRTLSMPQMIDPTRVHPQRHYRSLRGTAAGFSRKSRDGDWTQNRSAAADRLTPEPMVRRLTAGGNRIRTIGPGEGARRRRGVGSRSNQLFRWQEIEQRRDEPLWKR